MKKAILILLFNLYYLLGNAQINLIPNSDFETYNSCPSVYSQIYLAPRWGTGDIIGTPDLFNSCASTFIGVPQNIFGYQFAHSGNGYAGIYTYATNNLDFKEFLRTAIKVPLIPGDAYQFSMQVSLANYSTYAVNKLGIMLSKDSLIRVFKPWYEIPGFITDTTNWVNIQTTIIPDSAYKYLFIGVFHDAADYSRLTVNTQPNPLEDLLSYYYIDDVQLMASKYYEHFTKDTSYCDTTFITLSPQLDNFSSGYSWNNGASNSSITVNTPGTYWVSFNNGDFVIRDTFNVSVRSCKYKEHFTKDTTLCTDSSIKISVINKNLSGYSWSNGESTATITVTQPGQYIVTHSSSAAILNDTFNITLKDCSNTLKKVFAVPNAFSPNGDGLNDIFRVIYDERLVLEKFELQIYNRFGKEVYHSSNPDAGWDGSIKGTPQAPGAYLYKIRFLIEGQEYNYRNYLVLFR